MSSPIITLDFALFSLLQLFCKSLRLRFFISAYEGQTKYFVTFIIIGIYMHLLHTIFQKQQHSNDVGLQFSRHLKSSYRLERDEERHNNSLSCGYYCSPSSLFQPTQTMQFVSQYPLVKDNA